MTLQPDELQVPLQPFKHAELFEACFAPVVKKDKSKIDNKRALKAKFKERLLSDQVSEKSFWNMLHLYQEPLQPSKLLVADVKGTLDKSGGLQDALNSREQASGLNFFNAAGAPAQVKP
jgi:hypothetical protein